MQRLKNRVEKTLWETFEESKYKQVGEYIARWHDRLALHTTATIERHSILGTSDCCLERYQYSKKTSL